MEHTRASLAQVRQITAAVVACGLAAPAAGAEVGRVRIGEAEIAFETLGRSGPVVVFESGRGRGYAELGARRPPARGLRTRGALRPAGHRPQQPAHGRERSA